MRPRGGEGGRRERDGGRSACSSGVSWPGSLLPQSVARRTPLQEPGRESWAELGWREALRREDAPAQGAGLNRHAARRPGLLLSARMRFEIATRKEKRRKRRACVAFSRIGECFRDPDKYDFFPERIKLFEKGLEIGPSPG